MSGMSFDPIAEMIKALVHMCLSFNVIVGALIEDGYSKGRELLTSVTKCARYVPSIMYYIQYEWNSCNMNGALSKKELGLKIILCILYIKTRIY